MVGWNQILDEHEFEQAQGVGDGQGSRACCGPWGWKVGHVWATELIFQSYQHLRSNCHVFDYFCFLPSLNHYWKILSFYYRVGTTMPNTELSMWSESAQSCPTLCNHMDCSLPGSSLHGILQARILEWVAISFSRGSSRLGDWTQVSCIVGRHFNLWATREDFVVCNGEYTTIYLV